ncbi:sulfite exporter TauE/SafE family protein [Mycobacterium sp. 3519A]|jgi:uncharacterized membrane protein YfcA|uniref:sulfite exporter TauE/SafE family protein n=1 Tax=Mycobacterium sp. 3519A TaxID=2057184 RepID=UPI000C7B340C|nr:sulfite exporter TauE/SafE family protein [Mycobacterium sp. 3519A]
MQTSILVILVTMTFLGAGVVKGVTGMGLPTVAMGVLGIAMPPAAAAAMLVIPSLVTNVGQLLAGPAIVTMVRRLWPMMIGIVLGTVGGSSLLVHADPMWSGVSLGTVLIIYAGYALLTPTLSIPRSVEVWLAPLVGVVTGVITGATGILTIPAVPYLQALKFNTDKLIQALGLSFTTSTIALAVGLMTQGSLQLDHLGPSALAVVPAMAGMWVGSRIRSRISPTQFRRCFLALLILLGLELVCRPFI